MQIWRCAGAPSGHTEKWREGERERSIFSFHFHPGGSCGSPSCRHSRVCVPQLGTSLCHCEGPRAAQVSHQNNRFRLQLAQLHFFKNYFFTPSLLCLLVCLGENVQLPWMYAQSRSSRKDKCFACAVVLMGEQTSNNQFSSKVNNFYASDRKDEKHTSF